MRLGVIGRADPTGLGSMTIDFCNNVEVEKALIINRSERGKTDVSKVKAKVVATTENIDACDVPGFFYGVDAVVGFETFYSHDVVPRLHNAGIKTIAFPMWECSPCTLAACDLLIAVTDAEVEAFPKAVRIDWPMEQLIPIVPGNNPPVNFVSNGGSLGLYGRNNFEASVQAVLGGCFDGTDATLAIRCHDNEYATTLTAGHPKIKALPRTSERTELYVGADVIIHLQAFDGLSLPQLESAACGIPLVVMDIKGYERHPHRVPVSERYSYGLTGKNIVYARPIISGLSSLLRGLATGEIPLQQSPKPPTWAAFKEKFYEKLNTIA